MTINTQKLRRCADSLDSNKTPLRVLTAIHAAADHIDVLEAEIERLQRIIDSRPAINAGLPESYIHWSQSIYAMEAAHIREMPQ